MTNPFDFSAQAVTDSTVKEYVFDMIPGAPSLMVAPALEDNAVYLDVQVRMQIETTERLAKEAKEREKKGRGKPEELTAEKVLANMAEDRENDRRLIAEGCIRGWGVAPTAKDGSQPEFTPENARAFIDALPPYMFDALRNYARNLYNFVDRPPISPERARALGN